MFSDDTVVFALLVSLTARLMLSTWGPPGSCRPQVGPMLATSTLLSGILLFGREPLDNDDDRAFSKQGLMCGRVVVSELLVSHGWKSFDLVSHNHTWCLQRSSNCCNKMLKTGRHNSWCIKSQFQAVAFMAGCYVETTGLRVLFEEWMSAVAVDTENIKASKGT